ncbi:hypothetical protein JYK14_19965 [Siccirubricoccus sp. KC 17139]|uniref:Uncharacterized protein n=1 Tax=Siccirubricoccus soli TaxID=2899147 RepID=A0ABT1D8Z8_9PROT|nr:hypothetical protein [Siccirubricoccus soli]MCO6418423.1 hypothetical protein [Siccirubricoccus soli]MCP2684558.1 hypothetical protein [Siccirubricoccus soli]
MLDQIDMVLRPNTLPLRLTELAVPGKDAARGVHAYSTAGTWPRLARRAGEAAVEIGLALGRDLLQAADPRPMLHRLEPGLAPCRQARSVALFMHYSAGGGVSEMVLRQLRMLREQGFAVAFISTAAEIPEADWDAVRQVAALLAHRRNFGRDFGAWRDLIGPVLQRWPEAEEVLLMNDSILGPIRDPDPYFAALRAGGPGLFGLTESLQGRPHLQSYLVLARGAAAVADLALFLRQFVPSHSKWLVVQRGELRLSGWMRQRGHRVAALFGYHRLLEAALSDPAEIAQLSASHPLLRELERLPPAERLALLQAHPLNPTQHLWTVLVRRLGFPFLKTELVRRNPGHLPHVEQWPALVPSAAPCPVAVIKAHLASLRPRTV